MPNFQNILIILFIFAFHNAEGGMGKCPDGYRDAGGRLATKCFPCGPGWEDNKNSDNSCQKCPDGHYSNQNSNIICIPCTMGKFPNSHSSECVDCPHGQVKNVSSGTCEKCSNDTFPDITGQECVTTQRKIISEAQETRTSLVTSTFITTILCVKNIVRNKNR